MKIPHDHHQWKFKSPVAQKCMRGAAVLTKIIGDVMDFEQSPDAPEPLRGLGATGDLTMHLEKAAACLWKLAWEAFGHDDTIEWHRDNVTAKARFFPTGDRKPTAQYKATAAEREAFFDPDSELGAKCDVLSFLEQLLKANGYGDHHIVWLYNDARKPHIDNYVPSLKAIDAVIAAWNVAPDKERREMVNGWPSDMDGIQSPTEIIGEACSWGVDWRLNLFVDRSCNGVYGSHQFMPVSDQGRLQVLIPHGMTKADALANIDDIRDAIESGWDKFMARCDEEHTEPLTLAGVEGGEP